MQVSCESCGARYQLDDSRFSGRGARITCPRCQHVFVVYREEDEGKDIDPQEAKTAEVEPATSYSVDELDFRKVGIQAWKVKVKIGLVYDFSDYKTLAKYITDGRVTTADKISHDGKEWTEIGTIPDLAQHFIDVYVNAEQALNQSTEPSVDGVGEFDGDEPTDIFGLQQAEKAKAEAAAAKKKPSSPKRAAGGPGVDDELMNMARNMSKDMATGDAEPASGPPRFVDPFEARQRKKRAKARKEEDLDLSGFTSETVEESKSSRSKMLIISLFAVAAVAAIYIFQEMQPDQGDGQSAANMGAKNRANHEAAQAAMDEDAAEDAEVDGTDDAGVNAASGFTTGDGTPNGPLQCTPDQLMKTPDGDLVCPRCVVEGNCGDSEGTARTDPNGTAAPEPTRTSKDEAAENYQKAMDMRRKQQRQQALGFMDKAVEGDQSNTSYRVYRAELMLFQTGDHYECSSNRRLWKTAVADLKASNPERNADAAYLYGMYFLLCEQNKSQASYYLEIGKSSSKEGWGKRAAEEIEML